MSKLKETVTYCYVLLVAAAHEIPQELGDFGVLIHGGWEKSKALIFNVLSAVTFLLGGITAYMASFTMNVDFLELAYAASDPNFLIMAKVGILFVSLVAGLIGYAW